MILVTTFIKTMSKLKVTMRQLLLLICIHEKNWTALNEYIKMWDIPKGTVIGSIEFDQLINDGYLVLSKDKTGKTTFTDYQVSEKFRKIYINKFQASEELKRNYPAFNTSQGKTFPLKGIGDDELREKYAKQIMDSQEEHDEVLADLDYAIKNRLIFFTLKSFVESRAWDDIRAKRKKQIDTPDKLNIF